MKRLLVSLTVLSLVLLILLPACGGNNNETSTNTPAITATPTTTPTATPTATPSPTATVAPLTTIVAEPWLKISDSPKTLVEGMAFDREGNLYFVDVFGSGKVFKVTTADKKITTIYDGGRGQFSSVDVHKDGRLFICDVILGKILSMNPDGTGVTEILTSYKGAKINPGGMIFDSKGNFYFTNYQGSLANPTGSIFRVSSDFKTVDLVTSGLAHPSGICLAPEGNRLWVSEYDRKALVELDLNSDGVTLSSPAKIVCQFSGPGNPEFNAVDMDGNIYQAIVGDGKIVIVNKDGVPVAEVVTPGRDQGNQLSTVKISFQPGTDTAFMTACGKDGAYILTFKGLAKGLPLYSHQ